MFLLETLHTVTSCSGIINPFIMLGSVEETAFGCALYFVVSRFAPLVVRI